MKFTYTIKSGMKFTYIIKFVMNFTYTIKLCNEVVGWGAR
jgi:hypothetical protein